MNDCIEEQTEPSSDQGSQSILLQENSDDNSTSTNSLNAKVVRVGNRLLCNKNFVIYSENVIRDIEKLKEQRLRFSDQSKYWILTRCDFNEDVDVPPWARIFYLTKNSGIRSLEFLWDSVYHYNMLHLDTQLVRGRKF